MNPTMNPNYMAMMSALTKPMQQQGPIGNAPPWLRGGGMMPGSTPASMMNPMARPAQASQVDSMGSVPNPAARPMPGPGMPGAGVPNTANSGGYDPWSQSRAMADQQQRMAIPDQAAMSDTNPLRARLAGLLANLGRR